MTIKHKLATVLTAAALVTGGGLALAAPASAIDRVTCNSYEYFWITSDYTTCWENAGTTSVTLYNTTGGNSGNNTGRVDGPGFYRTFSAKYQAKTWNSTTVTQIKIN